jgi:RNA polymerase sigma-70 factor, ECF subfamily
MWGGRIATRDEVEAVYRSQSGQVWRAVLAFAAGQRSVADEATAEAFARLFVHPERVHDPVGWVFRTAFRLAVREMNRERPVELREADDGVAAEPSAFSDELTRALQDLSPDQRVVVFLHYFADQSLREIARLTGAPVATVKVRLHRARRALRVALEEGEAGYAG